MGLRSSPGAPAALPYVSAPTGGERSDASSDVLTTTLIVSSALELPH
jgi:hypothetical protein